MLIGVPHETVAGETRVAVTPETAKKLKAQGHTLRVQSGAGVAASATDEAYVAAGAEITDQAGAFAADLVLKVRSPLDSELSLMSSGGALVGMLNPFDRDGLQRLAGAGITSFALEAAPRTTRAQSMDVLSSQANIAGYKAVMMAADKYQRFFPMLMTAAGTVKAARVVISAWWAGCRPLHRQAPGCRHRGSDVAFGEGTGGVFGREFTRCRTTRGGEGRRRGRGLYAQPSRKVARRRTSKWPSGGGRRMSAPPR